MICAALYQHPDGLGTIEAMPGTLRITNEDAGIAICVTIGPDGLRELAASLLALADAICGVVA